MTPDAKAWERVMAARRKLEAAPNCPVAKLAVEAAFAAFKSVFLAREPKP